MTPDWWIVGRGVEPLAPRGQVADRPDRVAPADQRPDVRRAAQALGKDLRPAVEPDAVRSAAIERPAVARIDDRAATGRITRRTSVAPSAGPRSTIAARSRARNAASPSSSKISGMDRPAPDSIRSSRSTNGAPWRLASRRPTTLLPLPGSPISTTSTIGLSRPRRSRPRRCRSGRASRRRPPPHWPRAARRRRVARARWRSAPGSARGWP